jgi:large subunit ribosomal protein L9
MRAAFAKKQAVERGDAQKLSEMLNGVSLEISRKSGENDQLFGSVTSADISEALAAKGFTIDKRKITLADPIKAIGEFDIPIKLHREVSSSVKLSVRKEE